MADLRRDVVTALREAVHAHERGAFNEIRAAYSRLAAAAPSHGVDPRLHAAIEFLDDWYDSSNHDWQIHSLRQEDWPRIGLSIADSLESREGSGGT